MIREWIQGYNPQTRDDITAALREIMQEVALAGLQRTGFFEKAAFYGGTALRVFHGLDRFSEDLDFSLLEVDPDFSLEPYFEGIVSEFEAIGMKVSVKEKKKTIQSDIESAFLKDATVWKELMLEEVVKQADLSTIPVIRIKIEVDMKPPLGFKTEEKLLLRPFSFYVKCFTLPGLFAGKLHAVLFRKWGQRVKGRDWYDLEWYIKRGVPLDTSHFLLRMKDTGNWQEEAITREQIMGLLKQKIKEVSFDSIREDIVRFIPDSSVLDIWSPQYFEELTNRIKFD